MSDHDALSMHRVAEARSVLDARTAALRLRVQRGELVPRARVERRAVEAGMQLRDRIIGSPARHAAVLAADVGVAPAVMLAGLERIVRRMLARLADDGDALRRNGG